MAKRNFLVCLNVLADRKKNDDFCAILTGCCVRYYFFKQVKWFFAKHAILDSCALSTSCFLCFFWPLYACFAPVFTSSRFFFAQFGTVFTDYFAFLFFARFWKKRKERFNEYEFWKKNVFRFLLRWAEKSAFWREHRIYYLSFAFFA